MSRSPPRRHRHRRAPRHRRRHRRSRWPARASMSRSPTLLKTTTRVPRSPRCMRPAPERTSSAATSPTWRIMRAWWPKSSRNGGAIDCLVNNAGVPSPARGDLLDVRPEAFDQVLDVNLRGTFFFTQAVARHMTRNRFAQRALDHHHLLGERGARLARTRRVLHVEGGAGDADEAVRAAARPGRHRRCSRCAPA